MRRPLVGLALAALAATGCMSVPAGLRVVETSDPVPLCRAYANCYRPDLREIVLVPGQPLKVAAHEACHAHQHKTVLEETGREPSVDLHEWLATGEGRVYAAYVAGHPHPYWSAIAPEDTLLEDFAEACGRYLTQPVDDGRFPSDPYRDAFFEARGFR